jgi:hypothetical protein
MLLLLFQNQKNGQRKEQISCSNETNLVLEVDSPKTAVGCSSLQFCSLFGLF